jgi:hypothetical protein
MKKLLKRVAFGLYGLALVSFIFLMLAMMGVFSHLPQIVGTIVEIVFFNLLWIGLFLAIAYDRR